ncbi:MAG: nuclear transport factor 2 family protein [Bacteroidota bacterium]
MKYLILISVFSLLGGFSPTETTDEHAAIAQCLNYYLEGGTNNDFETLAKAFHTDATMQFVTDEGHRSVNALDFFEKGIKPGPPQKRKTRIVSINVEGNAAQAKLQIEYDTFYFHDYMQLLKIGDEWKIICKSFYRQYKEME